MQFIKNILFGRYPVREFITVDQDNIRERVYLGTGQQLTDVSSDQWLLCLDPAIFGVWITSPNLLEWTGPYKLHFTAGTAAATGAAAAGNIVAELTLTLFDKITEEQGTLLLLKATHSRIRHVHPLKARLFYSKFYKKPGVTYERFKAAVAAFSYPRRVRIISFTQDKEHHYFFPMDLLGEVIGAGRYVFGLRHSNLALKHIIETQKIVVAEVPARYKSVIYELGKGHLSAPPPIDERPFAVVPTAAFDFCIPDWSEGYKEIKINRTMNIGSQMLLWGEWTIDHPLHPSEPHLYHIHFLQWLYQKKNSG